MDQKITALKVQKHDQERINIFLDGEFAFGCSRIIAAWLHVGQELSAEKIEQLKTAEFHEHTYQLAINYISFRERSEAEIRQYLQKHGISEENTQITLERLRNNGLVDDTRFSKTWIENRNTFRPRSQRALKYELARKGISNDQIQTAVSLVDDDEMAYQAARQQAHRLAQLPWPTFRKKILGTLARRGFSYDTSALAATRIWEELGNTETLEIKEAEL